MLPSKLKAYCDTSDDESRVLASGGKNEGDESDRIFLELLADSAGGHFGIEMSGGPPSRVRTAIDRAFVVTFFVNLFEVMGLEEDVRSTLTADTAEGGGTVETAGDFRHDVEAWLDLAMPARPDARR